MMRAPLVLLCATLLASGCFRYRTRVPGVVDLRSDASDVPRAHPAEPDDRDLARDRGSRILEGEGVRTDGSLVTVEDRHVFLRGIIPVWNTSAHEELASALALSGGLAEVEIGEEQGPVDAAIALLASFLPLAGYLLPSTYTFHASGEALALDGRARGRRAPSPSPLPLPPPPGDLPPPPPVLEDQP